MAHRILSRFTTSPVVLAVALAGCSFSAEAPAPSDPAAAPVADAGTTGAKGDAGALLARLQDRLASVDMLKPVLEVQAVHGDVRDGILRPLAEGLKAGATADVFVAGAEVPAFNRSERRLVRRFDGIEEFAWGQDLKATADTALPALIAQFSEVVDADLVAKKIDAQGDKATVTVGYDLRGITTDGSRRTDRGDLTFSLVRADGAWKVSAIDATDLRSFVSDRKPTFADMSEMLASVEITPRSEAIRRGGYATAASDFDGDKKVDLLVGRLESVRLLRNTGAGFEDVTEKAGIRPDTKVKSAGFVDLDNDGHKDLVMVRFVEKTDDDQSDFVAYRNNGDGTFELKGDVLTRSRMYDRSMPLAVADFDGNGFLDIYVGFPGSRDFTNQLGENDRPENIASQGVWLNDGQWGFSEIREAPGYGKEATGRRVYPHAALVSDLNMDGKPDILVTDDSGRINPVYYNAGDGSFQDAATSTGLAHTGWGMGAAVADYDGDGLPDVYMSNIDFAAGHMVLASLDGKAEGPLAEVLAQAPKELRGNALFRNKGDGTFEEVSAKAGVAWAGEAPAVAEWVDYNADGAMDLYVPNGLWSGGEQAFDDLFLAAALASGAYAEFAQMMEQATGSEADNADGQFDLAIFADRGDRDPNPVLTILREFKGDLANLDAEAVSEIPTLSFAGYERNRLFRNNSDGTFTEVGFLENADRIEDGYVASSVDVNGDGKQDLFLRNCDPAPGHPVPTLVLLQNQAELGHALTVEVEGTKSNRDGIGALVSAWVDGTKVTREIRSVSGAVQHQPLAWFGLGEDVKVDKLEVTFPSGVVRSFEDVDAGRVIVNEGDATLRLATASR